MGSRLAHCVSISTLISVLIVIGCLCLADEAWAAQDEATSLSVSIAVPVRGKVRFIENGQFHVVVRNNSTHPVSFWREWCSWGYFNLSFEATDENGKTWTIKKKDRGWNKNYPDFCTVDANGDFVIDVTLKPDTWETPPQAEAGKSKTVTLRAIYQVGETEEAKKNGVWTGKVVSEAKQSTFW